MNVKRRYVKPPTRASLAIYRLYYSSINVNYMGSFCPINSYENSVLNKSWFHSIRVRVAKLDFSKVSRVQNPLSFRHTGYRIGCPRKFQIWIVLTTYIYQPSLLTTIRFYPQISWWFSKPCTVVPHSWHSWCSNNSNNLGLWYIIYTYVYIYIYVHTLSMKKSFFWETLFFSRFCMYISISFYISISIYIYIIVGYKPIL